MNEITSASSLLNTIEMARVLNVSPETLSAWRKKGIVPYLKLRNVVRFNRERVLAALTALETAAK
jgi:excisionase family DNA binding protein